MVKNVFLSLFSQRPLLEANLKVCSSLESTLLYKKEDNTVSGTRYCYLRYYWGTAAGSVQCCVRQLWNTPQKTTPVN